MQPTEATYHVAENIDLIRAVANSDALHCESASCGNELTFDDIQAGDGLCEFCADAAADAKAHEDFINGENYPSAAGIRGAQ